MQNRRVRSPTLVRPGAVFARIVTFGRLEAASFTHSGVYLALLVCAFALGNPEPATFALGLSHGLIWILMSLICIAAARLRIIPFWLALTVVVLGGLGPFAGSIGFAAQTRRRARGERAPEPGRGRAGGQEAAVTVDRDGG
jgi:hypothetical protein